MSQLLPHTSFLYTVSLTTQKELFRQSIPKGKDEANIADLWAMYPGVIPHFFLQDSDYTVVKDLVARLCLTGKATEGVAMINVLILALEIWKHLIQLMTKELRLGMATAGMEGTERGGGLHPLVL